MFPLNVIDTIVSYSLSEDRLKLALVNHCFRHSVYSSLYRNIMVVDKVSNLSTSSDYTLVLADRLSELASCLTPYNFRYVRKVIINTHGSDNSKAVLELYDRIAQLWNVISHQIKFLSYDVVSLRLTSSLNNYLEHNLLSLTDCEDEVLTLRNRIVVNLQNWLMADTTQFLRAPLNPSLQRLSFLVESTFHQDRFLNCEFPEPLVLDYPLKNLQSISSLFLLTPLSFLKFTEMLEHINAPQLLLDRLSLTSAHRLANDAHLDFSRIMKHYDLNHISELELRLNCSRRHECQDRCMLQFFEHWRSYNTSHDLQTQVKKLSIVNHKSVGELVQFKRIIESHALSPLFPNLQELIVNCSNSTRASQNNFIDMCHVVKNLHNVPELRRMHLSSFFCEWVPGITTLFTNESRSFYHILTNRCSCQSCNTTRGVFTNLAEVDKCNNYNHKMKVEVGDVSGLLTSESWVDFSNEANVRFFQYLTAEFRREEAIMEHNLTGTGTMLDMEHMPMVKMNQFKPFKELFTHSGLREVYFQIAKVLPNLQEIHFGGILVNSNDFV